MKIIYDNIKDSIIIIKENFYVTIMKRNLFNSLRCARACDRFSFYLW